MDRTEKATFTNMCMIVKGDMILVQNRTDTKWSGLSFPGGHVEKEESFVASVKREVYEETGLIVDDLELCGLKQFSTPKTGRYVVMLYKTQTFEGEIRSSQEGDIFWIHRNELQNYPLTPDFEMVLDVFTKGFTEFYFYNENDSWKKELL